MIDLLYPIIKNPVSVIHSQDASFRHRFSCDIPRKKLMLFTGVPAMSRGERGIVTPLQVYQNIYEINLITVSAE
jgi:hypothetical protein